MKPRPTRRTALKNKRVPLPKRNTPPACKPPASENFPRSADALFEALRQELGL